MSGATGMRANPLRARSRTPMAIIWRTPAMCVTVAPSGNAWVRWPAGIRLWTKTATWCASGTSLSLHNAAHDTTMRCRDETVTENRAVSPGGTADCRLVGISRYTASCGGRRQFLRLRRFYGPSGVHAAELPGVVWFQPDLYAVPENAHLCGD